MHGAYSPSRPAGHVHALERVQMVASWYTGRIEQEHDAALPDQELLEELLDGLRRCLADQRVLPSSDPAQVARIAADYAALYRELRGR
ncbi:hypothetical protein ACFVGN_09190 [Streptomyces sp. NPDC057757]|uniref:hypothetical protein n=1 Tax=Streptomyces sp. NPDC057757 TaxID=3346241 RepID=UPI0036B836EF